MSALGAEPAITEIRPVADLAVANANQIGQSIAGEVSEEDGFGAIGEDEFRPLLLVKGLQRPLLGPKAIRSQRSVPAESVVFANQQIGETVAGQIDELKVVASPIHNRQRLEGREWLPVSILGALVEPGRRPFEVHQIKLAMAGKVEQLLTAAAQGGKRGLASHQFDRCELRQRNLRAVDGLLVDRA